MESKMTRKMLDDYIKIKREIPVLKMEIQEMQTGEGGLISSTVFDYQRGFPRAQSVVGMDWKLFEKRKKILEQKRKRARAVEMWIESIEDGQTRCVFRMFYMEGMTWERIAAKTGYQSSPDYPRLLIRDKYLKKCGIK